MKKFKALFSAICMSLFIIGSVITVYAEEAQTTENYAAEQTQSAYSWVQDEIGVWKVKDAVGNVLSNVMFCDVDGSWYFLDGNGNMITGLINDNGRFFYFEETGKMITKSGDYGGFMLYICQGVNGTLGEITGGVENLINRGAVAQAATMPVNKVYALSNADSNSLTQDVGNISAMDSYQKSLDLLNKNKVTKDTFKDVYTPEELAKMQEALESMR